MLGPEQHLELQKEAGSQCSLQSLGGSAWAAVGRPQSPPSAERVGSNAVWRWRGLRARPASERKGRNLVAPRRQNEALSPTAAPWEPRSSPGSDRSPVRKAGRQRGRPPSPPPHPHTGEQMFPLSHRHHFGLSWIEPLPASSHHAQSLLDSSKTATPPSGSSERDFELRVASVRWRCSQVMRPPPLTASHTR